MSTSLVVAGLDGLTWRFAWPRRESYLLGGAFVAMLFALFLLPRAIQWVR